MGESKTSPVEIQDLWYRYPDQPPALQGITLSIPAGDWCAVLGPNGSGKSTLVKHFNGLLRPWRGRVLVAGHDTARWSIGQLAQIVGYLPQNPDRLIFSATVHEEIAFGPRQQGVSGSALEERVEQALAMLGLAPLVDLPPAILGYGIRRKVALAAVLAQRPRLLILDEPTNGLDAGNVVHLMGILTGLHERGTSIVMITHDLALVARYAQRAILMQAGRLLAHGDVRPTLTDLPLLARTGLAPLPITQLAHLLAEQRQGRPVNLLTPEEMVNAYFGAGHLEGQP